MKKALGHKAEGFFDSIKRNQNKEYGSNIPRFLKEHFHAIALGALHLELGVFAVESGEFSVLGSRMTGARESIVSILQKCRAPVVKKLWSDAELTGDFDDSYAFVLAHRNSFLLELLREMFCLFGHETPP